MKKILLIIAILLLTGCSSYQKSKMVEGLYHTVNPDFIPPNRDQVRLGFSENDSSFSTPIDSITLSA